ncbi:MAG: hypothetical protein PHN38_06260 [Sulfurospirillaceae bacterium]|nr:hypothetical protein [Sulfurospirillaceae bacterium]MDD3462513.1 hypothetical protein [Sulfurospirillaceae bacterium]
MRKLLSLVMAAFFMMSIATTSVFADAQKGQKAYLKYLKSATKLNGADFAKQQTQEEWKALFANDGAKFIEKYSAKFPDAAEFFKGEKFKKLMNDVRDFCVEYASDSGNVPAC